MGVRYFGDLFSPQPDFLITARQLKSSYLLQLPLNPLETHFLVIPSGWYASCINLSPFLCPYISC